MKQTVSTVLLLALFSCSMVSAAVIKQTLGEVGKKTLSQSESASALACPTCGCNSNGSGLNLSPGPGGVLTAYSAGLAGSVESHN